MSSSYLVHRQTSNSGLTGSGGALGTTNNTFYGRKLTDNLINESSTVNLFRNNAGGINANQFDLVPGTYRISATLSYVGSDSSTTAGSVFGLYNITDAVYESHAGTSELIFSNVCAGQRSSGPGNRSIRMEGQFTVSGSIKSFALRQANKGATASSSTFTATGQSALISGSSTMATYDYFGIIKILKIN